MFSTEVTHNFIVNHIVLQLCESLFDGSVATCMRIVAVQSVCMHIRI